MFGVFIILLFMGILPADMSVYHMHVVSRGQRDPPETGMMGGSELLCGCWDFYKSSHSF